MTIDDLIRNLRPQVRRAETTVSDLTADLEAHRAALSTRRAPAALDPQFRQMRDALAEATERHEQLAAELTGLEAAKAEDEAVDRLSWEFVPNLLTQPTR